MGQFDVYENLNPGTNQDIPYLLNIRADLLETPATRKEMAYQKHLASDLHIVIY